MAEQDKKLVRIQHKIDTQANWLANDIVLLKGELGLESDTNLIKMGDGVRSWTELPYILEAELEEIAEYIHSAISDEAANRVLSNLSNTSTARENLGVPPKNHALNATTYGPATTANYGHVRTAGKTGDGHYVQHRSANTSISSLNATSYTYAGQYGLSFSGSATGVPATLVEDSGASSSTTFYGVLTVDNYVINNTVSTSYGVRQVLSIPKYGLTYERYCYTKGSSNWGEWRNTAEGASAYTEFITVPFDEWVSYNEGEYYYYDYTFPELEETDEIIIDVVTSTDELAIPMEVTSYAQIGKVEYGDQYMKFIAYNTPPLLDVVVKALIIKTK